MIPTWRRYFLVGAYLYLATAFLILFSRTLGIPTVVIHQTPLTADSLIYLYGGLFLATGVIKLIAAFTNDPLWQRGAVVLGAGTSTTWTLVMVFAVIFYDITPGFAIAWSYVAIVTYGIVLPFVNTSRTVEHYERSLIHRVQEVRDALHTNPLDEHEGDDTHDT